jgi:opacity protein-like surface antigen
MTCPTALLSLLLALNPVAPPQPPAGDPDSLVAPESPAPADTEADPEPEPRGATVEALVPDVAGNPYRLDPGPRGFLHRFAFSPGYGRLGSQVLFAFRFAYNPDSWLGYEGTLSHNPGQSVHAVLHTLSAIVRHPLTGRYQPYLTAGYGMMIVFPGQSLNAASVTKNALTLGGGLEFYIRSDLAIRAELAQATVLGKQRDRDGVVAYNYLQQTIGLSFYRSIRP